MSRHIDADKLERGDLCDICESADCSNCFSDDDFEEWIAKQPTVGGWIPVSDKLPAEVEPVNVTWINRDPEPYYVEIKDTPFTATAVYCKGKWWWYSATCEDYLREYLQSPGDAVDNAIEILAWQPIPEPYKKGGAE